MTITDPDHPSGVVPRHLEHEVREALESRRVVFIAGPRQAGKTTLARLALSGQPDVASITLDDERFRSAASHDPAGLVRHEGTLVIDEVQRVPDLLLAIKAEVDRSDRSGQFLLTGSADALALPRVAEALAGRMRVLELMPFSQGELEGRQEGFIDRAFAGWPAARINSTELQVGYLNRATAGGFPEAIRLNGRQRSAWFDDYVRTVIQRDVSDITAIARVREMDRLVRALAGRSANVYVRDGVADALGLPATTIARYVTLLETTYLVRTVPGWANSRTSRATRHPKVYVTDTGLLAHLLGTTAGGALGAGGLSGPILETFVAMEISRQLDWAETRATQFHFRTRDGAEVDIVLVSPSEAVVGIEVKSSSTVRASDFTGLRLLEDKAGARWRCGLVMYTGDASIPFGPRMWALPISCLWTT